MWRVAGKTIFSRWHKAGPQTAVQYQKTKQRNSQTTAISVIPDWQKNSYGDGRQHTHKQQRPCWDNPHFYYKAFCSHVLETVGWFGATAVCIDFQHRILRKSYFEEKRKCPFSNFALAMPKGKKSLEHKAVDVTISSIPECSSAAQPLLHARVAECSKVSDNLASGLEKFSQMAENSISALENSIGVAFLDHDKKQAFQFFKASAELGCPKGLFNLAVCYETGCGTKVNLKKAARYYQKAASKGHKYALFNLAVYTIKGLGGIEPDIEKGIQLLEKAAIKGVTQAQMCLGMHYLEEENWTKAYEMFKVASSEDNNAKYYLGMCYEYGWGVMQNYAVAMELYAEAARDGHDDATLKLGMFYEQGIDPDTDFSMTLYKMLMDKGHKGAEIALDRLHDKRRSRWKLKSSHYNEGQKLSEMCMPVGTSIHSSASLPDFRALVKDNRSQQERLLNPRFLPVSHLSYASSLSELSTSGTQSKGVHHSLDLAVKSPPYFNHVIPCTLIAANS